jgi:hypothetical protein
MPIDGTKLAPRAKEAACQRNQSVSWACLHRPVQEEPQPRRSRAYRWFGARLLMETSQHAVATKA